MEAVVALGFVVVALVSDRALCWRECRGCGIGYCLDPGTFGGPARN